MRKVLSSLLLACFCLGVTNSCASRVKEEKASTDVIRNAVKKDLKRVGMVIKIKPEYIDEYKALHADTNPGVRDLLREANMRNFSIFLHQLDDGNWYEFGYYEYTGDNFEADMEKLDKHPRNIEWLKICDPMQVPLEGYDGWAEMEQVYYNE
jgi:L-rhamnose mutarotase